MVCFDEEAAVSRMLRLRTETIEPWATFHDGLVVDYAGDGALVRFDTPDQAMACAIAIQRSLAEAEAEVEDGLRCRLRIGIDMGLVIAAGNGIAGRHVNIAARLEASAQPGGICLSNRVHLALTGRLRRDCTFAGNATLKHIEEPVEVWIWSDTSLIDIWNDLPDQRNVEQWHHCFDRNRFQFELEQLTRSKTHLETT